jgi:hypothetical protein
MAIETSKTIENDGKVYPFLAVNMAISPKWGDSDVGGALAVRLTPYRVDENGQIERYDAGVEAVVAGDLFVAAQADPALGQAINAVMAAIQTYVNAKGL